MIIMVIDLIAIVISICSIFLSSAFAFVDYRRACRSAETELESENFKRVLTDVLVKSIPAARSEIHFDQDKNIVGYSNLMDKLNKLKEEILYYKYSDKAFYAELLNAIGSIEDQIANARNTHACNDQETFDQELTKKLEDLYQLCLKRYYGKKKIKLKKRQNA